MAKNLLRRYKTQADYNAVKCELGEDIVGAIIENEDVKYGGESSSFIAVYDVTSTSSATQLFGNNFNVSQIDRMYIDDVEVTPTKTYTFSATGQHKIKCEVCGIDNCAYMFHNCKTLTSLDLSNFGTSNVTNMSWMFYSCRNLTSLDVTNFDTSKVTTMVSMFNYCDNLISLDVANFDTSNVTDMSNMFTECTDLTSLDVTNFDTSNVTNMYAMFSYCSSLTSLDVSNFNTNKVTDMSNMFYFCPSLLSLDVTNFNTSNVTKMGGMFSKCNTLTSLDLSNFDTSKVTSMYSMFEGCGKLTSLNLSNFDTSKVTIMYNMFTECYKLTSLDVSSFNTSNVTNMSSMFQSCTGLTSLDLSNFDTSNVTNMSSMFKNNILTSIKMLGDVSKVTSYNNMFYNIPTTGTLTINCDYEEAWNNILVTNQSTSKFPSTWSIKCSSCQPSTSYTDLTVTANNVAKCSTSGSFTVKANGTYTDTECNTATTSTTLSSSNYTVKYGTTSGSYTLNSITENNTTSAKTWYYQITSSSSYGSLTKTGSFTQAAGPCSCATSTTTTYSSYAISYNDGAVACNVTSVTPTVTATRLITTINSDCTTTTSSTSNYAITDYTVSYSPSGNNNGTTNRTITATVKHNGSNVGTFTYTQNSGATCYSTTDVTGTTYELKVLSTSIGKCDTTASPTVQGRSGVTHTTGATVWGSWTNLTKDTHYTITIPTITTNETSSSKTYNVTVSGKGVYVGKTASGTITQAAGPCYIMQKTSSDSSTAITFPGGITYMNYQGYICCYSVKDGVKQPVTISTDVSWLTCYENNDLPYDGANYNFRFDPQTNTSTSSRTGHITLTQSGSGKQVVWTIVQEGQPITYSYSATAENFDDCATSTTVKVYEKASTASTWTNITSEITPTIKYKTNSTSYSTSATKNSGSTSVVWSVQISFTRRSSSQSLVVNATQDAGPCPDLCSCTVSNITVSPSSYNFTSLSENKTFNVTITDNDCVNCKGGFKVYDSNGLQVASGTNSFSLLNQTGVFTIKANDNVSKTCTLRTTEYVVNSYEFYFMESPDETTWDRYDTFQSMEIGYTDPYFVESTNNGSFVTFTASSNSSWLTYDLSESDGYIVPYIAKNTSSGDREGIITLTQNGSNKKLYIVIHQEGERTTIRITSIVATVNNGDNRLCITLNAPITQGELTIKPSFKFKSNGSYYTYTTNHSISSSVGISGSCDVYWNQGITIDCVEELDSITYSTTSDFDEKFVFDNSSLPTFTRNKTCGACTPITSYTSLTVTVSNVAKCDTSVSFTVKANGKYTNDDCVTSTTSVTLSSSNYTVKYGTTSGSYTLNSITANETTSIKTWYYQITTTSAYGSLTKTGSFTQAAGPCTPITKPTLTITYSGEMFMNNDVNPDLYGCEDGGILPSYWFLSSEICCTVSTSDSSIPTNLKFSAEFNGYHLGIKTRRVYDSSDPYVMKINSLNSPYCFLAPHDYENESGYCKQVETDFCLVRWSLIDTELRNTYDITEVNNVVMNSLRPGLGCTESNEWNYMGVSASALGKCQTQADNVSVTVSGIHTYADCSTASTSVTLSSNDYVLSYSPKGANETYSSRTVRITAQGVGEYSHLSGATMVTQQAGPCNDTCSCEVESVYLSPTAYTLTSLTDNAVINVTINDNNCAKCTGGWSLYSGSTRLTSGTSNTITIGSSYHNGKSGTFVVRANDNTSKYQYIYISAPKSTTLSLRNSDTIQETDNEEDDNNEKS